MMYKKYRACLIGMIAIVVIIGAVIYVRDRRASEIPVDGTLVKNCEEHVPDMVEA